MAHTPADVHASQSWTHAFPGVVLDHDETRREDLLLMEMRAEELGASVEDASDIEAFQS